MKIVIDVNDFTTEKEMHNVLTEKLNFGPYYGKNLYALRDFVSDIERPIELVWMNSDVSASNLGSVFDYIVKIFKDAEQHDKDSEYNDKLTIVLK